MKIAYRNHKYDVFKTRYGYEIDSEFKDIEVVREIYGNWIVSNKGIDYTAYAEQDEEHVYVFIEGKQYVFKKVEIDSFSSDQENEGSGIIHSPMPGNVVKVLVKVGDEVEVGTPVLVIEAMKMESTLYADIKGIIAKINIENKEQVSTDKVLIRIEPK